MFLNWRMKLINWLAARDICVVVNSHTYDQLLDVNKTLRTNCIVRDNRIFNLERRIQKEVAQRIELERQGVSKQGRAFVLKN